jgi:hypothetical protein
MCNAYIKRGEIGGKQITYVCKSWVSKLGHAQRYLINITHRWRTSIEWDGGFYLEVLLRSASLMVRELN